MKKMIFYFILIFIILPLPAKTQNIIYLKIGTNQSKIRGDITNFDFNQKHKPFGYEWTGGLIAAIAFQFKPANYFVIEPEFQFTENGFDQRYYAYYLDSLLSTSVRNFKLDYFKFSVLFKWYLDSYLPLENHKVSVFALAGPNLSVLVNAVSKEKNDLDPLNELELYDFGFTFGMGSAYHLGAGSISLELRYYLGFVDTKLFQFYSDHYDVSTETYNKSWELLFGYSFPIVK